MSKKRVAVVYRLGDTLYVNTTSRCSSECRFCVAGQGPELWGYRLQYDAPEDEPDAVAFVEAIGNEEPFDELVFCGFGEPLLRFDVICDVLQQLELDRSLVRINTNGQAFLFHGPAVLDELEPLVGRLSVSLNAPDEETYVRVCRPTDQERAFSAVLDFIRQARHRFHVLATAVAYPGVDLEATARLAEELGVPFHVRGYR